MGRKVVSVDITQKDINSGWMDSRSNCPIALVLKRLGKKNISVQGNINWFRGMYGMCPYKANEFMIRFDLGLSVRPISFNLYEEN